MTDPTLPPQPSEPPAQGPANVPSDPTQFAGWSASVPARAVSSSGRPLPGSILASGVLLIVGAALALLLAIVIAFAGFAMSQMPLDFSFDGSGLSQAEIDASMAMAGIFIAVFAGIAALAAIAHLVAGIGVLRRQGWARILGLVLAVLGCLLFLVVLVSTLASPDVYLTDSGFTQEKYRQFALVGRIVGLGIAGIGLAVYAFVLVVLARRGSEFS